MSPFEIIVSIMVVLNIGAAISTKNFHSLCGWFSCGGLLVLMIASQ